jgi:hypothetical protein
MSLKNSVTPPGIDPGTVRLVAQRFNHYAPNTEKYLRQIGWKLVEWIHLAQDNIQCQAGVNASIKLRLQHESGTFLSTRMTTSF